MRRVFIRLIVLFILFLLISGCTPSQKGYVPTQVPQGDFELASQELDKFIEAKMKNEKIIGFSIAVVSDNDIVFMKGYGYADKENQDPVTTKTLFRVGSISKLFTATAVRFDWRVLSG